MIRCRASSGRSRRRLTEQADGPAVSLVNVIRARQLAQGVTRREMYDPRAADRTARTHTQASRIDSPYDGVARAARASATRLLSTTLFAVAVACGHDGPNSPGPTGSGVSIGLPNGARVDTLAVGEQVQVLLIWRDGQRPGRVAWSSDSPSVATVSSTGLVTALAPGSATVSATNGVTTDTVSIVVTRPPSQAVLPVFPGAVGFGATTPAGRGGTVIRVTNLDDMGPGSLRAALQANGTRTIIFDVGGTITLSTRIIVRQPFVTLAGQTAPAPGVTLRGAGMSIRTHDVLIQHLRVRPGDGPGDNPVNRDAIEIQGPNGYNIVIDHVSLSWATDENFSTWYNGAHDITLSNSIVAEGLEGVEQSFGVLVGDSTRSFAVIGTLMAHNAQRNPYFKGATTGIAANNVIYDWSGAPGMYYADPEGSGPTQFALVGNVGIRGPDSPNSRIFKIYDSAKPGTKLFVSDNSDTRVNAGVVPADPWSLVQNQAGSAAIAQAAPVWPTNFTAAPNPTVYDRVLANAGAWPGSRDAADMRIVADVRNRTGRNISSQSEVGGWPDLGTPRRALALPANPNGDDDGNGYTNLEEWLHQLAAAAEGR